MKRHVCNIKYLGVYSTAVTNVFSLNQEHTLTFNYITYTHMCKYRLLKVPKGARKE